MPSRHAFAHVLATTLIAIAAAALHLLLGPGSLQEGQPHGVHGRPDAAGYGSGSGPVAKGR